MTRLPAGAALIALALAGCGGGGDPEQGGRTSLAPVRTQTGAATPPPGAAGPAFGDWTRFGVDAARTNVATAGPPATRVRRLREQRLALPGTVDASPIALRAARVRGARHDVLVMTTTYGRTFALDAHTGRRLWTYTPRSYARLAGSPQITNTTPVADPNRRHVYAATPDGHVRKLRLGDGREVVTGAWPARVTRNASHEKLASALNLDGRFVLATTGGYIGDAPPYQGKVLAIDRGSGRVAHVFNSLCSDRRRIIDPSTCPAQASAIWGRAGAVVDPATRRVYATTSNGPFDGRTNWGDSVLELSPGAARFLRHYTPEEHARLEAEDTDLGSTAPALLPSPAPGRRARYLVQGGKDGKLRLLALDRSLHGVTGAAGRRTGGHVQIVPAPGGAEVFTALAVDGPRLFVATFSGTAAWELRGGRLRPLWSNDRPGTSPVLAGGLLYVFDPGGALVVYAPRTGRVVARKDAPTGHWNSPIVTGGAVYLPGGDANDHATRGVLAVYR